jgi:hypothetical protein
MAFARTAAPWATTSRTEGLTGKQAHPPAPVVVVSAIDATPAQA